MNPCVNIIGHICKEHYHEILKYKNVVGVGQSYKVVDNIETNKPCICVMVTKKYPLEELDLEDIIPEHYYDIVTDVIEVGEIESIALTGRIRPMQFGYSIGILGVNSAGTAGCMVKSTTLPTLYYILSNNHVLANINSAPINSQILQPSQIDGGKSTDVVATLSRYVTIRFMTSTSTPTNLVDCAIAKITNTSIVTPNIAYIGKPTGIAYPYLNMYVKKVGRTTGFTSGYIRIINASVYVSYGSGRTALFTNQIVTTAMSYPGDSGSLLLDGSNRAVGLLFAGSTSSTVYNPIVNVLNALNVSLVI